RAGRDSVDPHAARDGAVADVLHPSDHRVDAVLGHVDLAAAPRAQAAEAGRARVRGEDRADDVAVQHDDDLCDIVVVALFGDLGVVEERRGAHRVARLERDGRRDRLPLVLAAGGDAAEVRAAPGAPPGNTAASPVGTSTAQPLKSPVSKLPVSANAAGAMTLPRAQRAPPQTSAFREPPVR